MACVWFLKRFIKTLAGMIQLMCSSDFIHIHKKTLYRIILLECFATHECGKTCNISFMRTQIVELIEFVFLHNFEEIQTKNEKSYSFIIILFNV